ncbi:hypothetical protein B9T31_15040 [Acinetobacter sp. ANC 4558]|uniref:hypothetical protein n=1 Tax=Acinetobacter sp. ANC 4558 TaxID=1977876 RepID=UPI000A33271E|nr:hypothetical protein [Acinetobacter sp. ANC 4558]OTG81835.1 hypothetical protein B9T31_15040 [Acinetobacter sp. ANC 4558]
MKLRLCANIDLKNINIAENMKPEIKTALAIELTKAKVARWEEDQKGVSTQGVWWVQAFHEAEKEINQAEKNFAKSKSTMFD